MAFRVPYPIASERSTAAKGGQKGDRKPSRTVPTKSPVRVWARMEELARRRSVASFGGDDAWRGDTINSVSSDTSWQQSPAGPVSSANYTGSRRALNSHGTCQMKPSREPEKAIKKTDGGSQSRSSCQKTDAAVYNGWCHSCLCRIEDLAPPAGTTLFPPTRLSLYLKAGRLHFSDTSDGSMLLCQPDWELKRSNASVLGS